MNKLFDKQRSLDEIFSHSRNTDLVFVNFMMSIAFYVSRVVVCLEFRYFFRSHSPMSFLYSDLFYALRIFRWQQMFVIWLTAAVCSSSVPIGYLIVLYYASFSLHFILYALHYCCWNFIDRSRNHWHSIFIHLYERRVQAAQ